MSDEAPSNPTKPTKSLRPTRPPLRVCILGSTAAGKTCMIAGLALLAEPDRRSPVVMGARGASKVRLEELADTLRHGVWPPPTNTIEHLQFDVMIDQRAISLSFFDYPGEDFQRLFDRDDNEVANQLQESLAHADVLMLVLDLDRDIQGTDLGAVKRRDALLLAIVNLRLQLAKEQRNKPDVALVLTKVDRQPQVQTPSQCRRLIRQHAPQFFEKITNYGGHVEVFPLSAVGRGERPEGNSAPPAKLEPTGYEPLLRWILAYRSRKRRRRTVTVVSVSALVLAALMLLFGGWASIEASRVDHVLNNPRLDAGEKILRGEPGLLPGLVSPATEQNYQQVTIDHLDALEERITLAASTEEIAGIQKEIAESFPNKSHGGRVEKLKEKAERRREELSWRRLGDLGSTLAEPEFVSKIDEFLTSFPASSFRTDAVELKEAAVRRMVVKQRNYVASVSATSPQGCQEKAKQMRLYLESAYVPDSSEERTRILRAAELADFFAVSNTYDLTIKRVGTFVSPYAHGLRLKVGPSDPVEIWSETSSTSFTPDRTFQVTWKVNEPVRIDWILNGWWNIDIATLKSSSPFALADIVGSQAMGLLDDRYTKEAIIKCEVTRRGSRAVGTEDWAIVRDYVWPGSKWSKVP